MMPQMSARTEGKMKRRLEQCWIHDAVVKTVGVERDQGRIRCAMKPCGPEATLDFVGAKARVQKFFDIAREFGRAAERREAIARKFDGEQKVVSA
jgi:hypothetical protein